MANIIENGAAYVWSWSGAFQIELQLLCTVLKSIIIVLTEIKGYAKSSFQKPPSDIFITFIDLPDHNMQMSQGEGVQAEINRSNICLKYVSPL